MGFEPTTFRLGGKCSTIEPQEFLIIYKGFLFNKFVFILFIILYLTKIFLIINILFEIYNESYITKGKYKKKEEKLL